MDLTFELGDPQRPRGHALLYFHVRDAQQVVATYVLTLPIQMDMGKYIPPLLAAQFGSVQAGEISTFAAPPMPEVVEGVEHLERLAKLRQDDLVYGGTLALSDVAMAIQETNEAVQAYARSYQDHIGVQPETVAGLAEEPSPGADVQRVVYELLSERDRLGEISRLVGTVRFAIDRKDEELARESDASLEALQSLLPDQYWVERVRAAAHDVSETGTTLAQLYVERCYKLLDQEFAAVRELERRIADTEAQRT